MASTVTLTPVNSIPTVANPIADQNVNEGSLFSFTVPSNVFEDVEPGLLTLSATLDDGSALPAWLDFDPVTQSFSGTPADADVGTLSVRVTARDASGDAVSDTFDITVANIDNAPVIGGVNTGAVAEDDDPNADGQLDVTGTLTIADPDIGESGFVTDTIIGTYGDLSIDANGSWSYSADNSQTAIQQLDTGESLTETFTLTTVDGTGTNVRVTIGGSEDVSVISGAVSGTVAEDTNLDTGGALSISDVDSADNPVAFPAAGSVPGDNGYGSYTLNNELDEIQSLDEGETLTDTHTYIASDGSSQVVTIVINGTEDAAVISGELTGSVVEDLQLTVSGTFEVSDADASDNPVSMLPVAGVVGDSGFGTFELDNGTWTYTLNNAHLAVQNLEPGVTLTDTHAFVASDGTIQQVSVIIEGAAEEKTSDIFETATIEVEEKKLTTQAPMESGLEEALAQTSDALSGQEESTPAERAAQEEEEQETEEESDSEVAATIDVSEFLNVYKQRIAAPRMHMSSTQDNSIIPPAYQGESQISIIEKDLDKYIDLANLSINQIEVRNLHLTALREIVRSDSFRITLNQLGDKLDEAFDEQQAESRLGVATAASIVVGVSASVMAQVLRAGSLFASFLSVVPLWRQFDPLPILTKTDDDEEDQENQEEGQGDEANVTTEPVEPETDERDEFEALFDQSIEEDD